MMILINSNRNPVVILSIKGLALSCFILFLITNVGHAQSNSMGRSFKYYNAHDRHSLFLENESRSLPGEKDSTYSITIIVKNIRNKEGVIRFKFYNDSTPFPHDKGFLRIVIRKSELINDIFTATYYGFTSGYMGIALHDDENCNKKLDFGWFLPREGYAFSDYYHTRLQRPDYCDFRFLLNENKVVVMRMKYH
ncbi:MAG: DUF2141 domain-containing protein [Bacteroidia bacterium]|nr:DUF2141 domain-containing protein [Bacteroidia bacterium]